MISTNTKSAVIAVGVPSLTGGLVGAAPGYFLMVTAESDTAKKAGIALAFVGAFIGTFYVTRAIIKA